MQNPQCETVQGDIVAPDSPDLNRAVAHANLQKAMAQLDLNARLAEAAKQDEEPLEGGLVAVTPENLKGVLAETNGMKLRKVTATRAYNIRRLLSQGEDPFLVAVYFKVPFTPVAQIANSILAEMGSKETIPTTVPGYLALAAQLEAKRKKVEEASRAAVDVESEICGSSKGFKPCSEPLPEQPPVEAPVCRSV